MACKEGQFDVVKQFKTFGINLNDQHVNGMTPFDFALSTVFRYSRVGLFADLSLIPLPYIDPRETSISL